MQTLYSSLQELLNQVVYTHNRRHQLKLLDKVYSWYYEKVGPKETPNPTRLRTDMRRRSLTPASLRNDAVTTFPNGYIYYTPEPTHAEMRMEKRFRTVRRKQLKDRIDGTTRQRNMIKWTVQRAR
jgi:hypothetical protein